MAARGSGIRLLAGYYLATPVFAVADLGFGAPVRVADVLPTGLRMGYYAAVFALGFMCAARPLAAPWVGMGESAANLLVLLLSILLPIWSAGDAILAGGAVGPVGLDASAAANALLSGTALVVSFQRHQAAAVGRGRSPRLPGGV